MGTNATRAAQDDSHVFDGVMVVDPHVAARFDVGIEAPVPDECVEHVVEEADARVDRRVTRPVEAKRSFDRSLGRDAFDHRRSHDDSFPRRDSASITRSFSCGVPTVMRRQSPRSGSREKSLVRMENSSRSLI